MILQYNPAISTMAATTMVDPTKTKALPNHFVLIICVCTQALSFTFKAKKLGMLSINGKNQEARMIT